MNFWKLIRTIMLKGTVFVVFLQFVGCAGSPAMLAKMDSTEIQKAEDTQLCRAYAIYKAGWNQQYVPVINNEVTRRGLTCKEELERYVSDCSKLSIVSVSSKQREVRRVGQTNYVEKGTTLFVTVKNNTLKNKSFRIYDGSTLSSTLNIRGGETKRYGIFTSNLVSAINGKTQGNVRLNDCVSTQ